MASTPPPPTHPTLPHTKKKKKKIPGSKAEETISHIINRHSQNSHLRHTEKRSEGREGRDLYGGHGCIFQLVPAGQPRVTDFSSLRCRIQKKGANPCECVFVAFKARSCQDRWFGCGMSSGSTFASIIAA